MNSREAALRSSLLILIGLTILSIATSAQGLDSGEIEQIFAGIVGLLLHKG
jgi:hypothetical protein